MLARGLRRRPNIDPTLVQCIVFAGVTFVKCVVDLIYISDTQAREQQ